MTGTTSCKHDSIKRVKIDRSFGYACIKCGQIFIPFLDTTLVQYVKPKLSKKQLNIRRQR